MGTDQSGQPVPNAVVEVNGIQKNITTSYFGEYWRLLSPGKYCIRATSPDGSQMTEWVQITVAAMDSKKHVRVDFTLSTQGAVNSVNTCDLEPRVPIAPAAPVNPSVAPVSQGSFASSIHIHTAQLLTILLVLHS